MTAGTPLLWEQSGHVVTLTLNRPEKRNALTGQKMFAAFEEAFERLNADLSVRVAILTGAGKAFCAGGDVKEMRDRAGMFGISPAEIQHNYRTGIQRIPLAFGRLDVPVIAAVNGPAIGAGCDLACMCDIRIAGTSAKFAESFVRLGIIPGDGGAWLLPRVVGMSRACELAFTGDTIDAAAALEFGLVSRVVPDERLLEEARALALRIAANPPQALRWTKRLIREGQHVRLDTMLDTAAVIQALAHHTEDHAEAISAYFEKRPARFQGK
jgi:2-(1,2-epoxy-1,2-dihydrophenyl)acetyl-CoA isomerase